MSNVRFDYNLGKSEIHTCSFENIGEDTFKGKNNSLFLWSENLLVETTVRSFDCDMSLIETTEGFFLTTSLRAKGLPKFESHHK